MANIGSVFLGDSKRIRVLSSSSTPPSSPPLSGSSMSAILAGTSPTQSPAQSPPPASTSFKSSPAAKERRIDPALSLELRLRWLEAIVFGVKHDRKGKEKERVHGDQTLIRAAETLQRTLDTIVENNDGLKRFMSRYEQHAHLLTPSFALAGLLPDPPAYQNMSQEELNAFIGEMGHDIRSADRDMQEIDALQRKGVTGAGKLADYEQLQPRLEILRKSYDENIEHAARLEKRIAAILERHSTQVDTLSELFVTWDDTLTDAEHKITKLERALAERRRMGLQ
ncbi:uncharacterized protein EV420DRAFT_1758916 [Desarmillaria tabescens]|uniref:Uncharacterized protein n=1 Tax=Armillaria tabescens TaxID=1929756 RepID=A0AA39U4T8_ARMTA|nr:uncharacterized protein EV420DRAFT_1758916 [Desarmillaria tabescens]KAK0467040.1 hypothetical protein EV420DRAFT_1758916 [Desarmillaria tabescens]